MAANGWITEGLVQFSESPLWRTPVENFIDDNCCIFSTDPEMKLEYTIVHKKFQELIDSLLTGCVTELGVSMETAVDALRETLHHRSKEGDARTQRHGARKMLTQVFSADNFSSFYTMMVKRNMELDILANASLAAHGVPLAAEASNLYAGMEGSGVGAAVRSQREKDVNGDVAEDEALRLAIAASLQDPQAEAQVRAYDEVCAQEAVNFQVQDAEREAEHQKEQLEQALQGQPGTPEVEQYRQEHLQRIDHQRNSQILQIQNYSLSGPKQSFYHDKRRPMAEFGAPETLQAAPQMASAPAVAATSAPLSIPAPVVASAVVAPATPPPAPAAPAPALPAAAPPGGALPPIGRSLGALPSIAGKPLVPSSATPTAGTTSTAVAAPPTVAGAGGGPSKTELEQRAQYMRQQREMILARNRASRQQQLNTYVQQSQPAGASPASATAASANQKDVTVEIAKRLRGDLVGEGRRGSK